MKLVARLFAGLSLLSMVACGAPGVDATGKMGGGSPSGGGTKPGGSGSGASNGSSSGSGSSSNPGSPGTGPIITGMAGGGAVPGSPGNNCGMKTFDLHKGPAEMLVVLDRSGSMLDAVPGVVGSKWMNVTAALGDTIMQTDGAISWGLKTFPNPTACTVPDGVDVPIAAKNYMPLWTYVQGNIAMMGGATPTALAINKSVAYLKSLTTNTTRYLVLATDGLPNCADPVTGRGNDPMGAVNAVMAAAGAGYRTFVIGIATLGTMADTTLSQMAMAGGEPRAGTPPYYPVANKADLVAALGLITGQVTNCLFPLDTPPGNSDLTVKINGMTVPRDPMHMSGWDLTASGKAVEVYGQFCDQLKANSMDKIEITYGCVVL